jgi:hypothetical protein
MPKITEMTHYRITLKAKLYIKAPQQYFEELQILKSATA